MEHDIRLSLENLEKILKESKTIGNNETLIKAHIEPGELVITIDSKGTK